MLKVMENTQKFRIFDKAHKIIIQETNRRIAIFGRPHSKQGVLNDMILEYPQMLERIKQLDK